MKFIALFLSLALVGIAHAQDAPAPVKKKKKPHPAMVPVEDVAGLPRVLLIGDSISIGYTVPTRNLLKGKANVHRPLTNCESTREGVQKIDGWLGEEKWDVIHFNWGLHDLKFISAESPVLADPEAEGSAQKVPPVEYEANLRKLVERLQATGAKLIWRNTTPVPEGSKGRIVGHAEIYNGIAAQVMKEYNVEIQDLYTFVLERQSEIQREANVHFTDEGSQALADEVAAVIEKSL